MFLKFSKFKAEIYKLKARFEFFKSNLRVKFSKILKESLEIQVEMDFLHHN